MIASLCNIVEDFNMDTFDSIVIFDNRFIPKFNHLTDPDFIATVVYGEELQEGDDEYAIIIPLLPEKLIVSSNPKVVNQNDSFFHSISFPVVPQDKNLRILFSKFNNREVVALLNRKTFSQLYGTSIQPLLFTVSELHSNNKRGLKGFTINISGESYALPLYLDPEIEEIDTSKNALAFNLAGEL